MRACPVCGGDVPHSRYGNRVYCSVPCRDKAGVDARRIRERAQTQMVLASRACPECQGPVVGARRNQRFCSTKCRSANTSRRWTKLNPSKARENTVRYRAALPRPTCVACLASAKSPDARYCSSCERTIRSRRATSRGLLRAPVEARCRVCGVVFRSRAFNATECSADCHRAHVRPMNRARYWGPVLAPLTEAIYQLKKEATRRGA